ncbi:DUF1194 domain-containing protein [Aquibium oceanicum]|uniref:VWFA domain-containing protein n=1 Tax=Aquibium oceanicum TaxID=1670800 RepID=A0A1L3STD0_9HYPH|nr:DUF1194 domain-containing protein [Aquibium oceanicum]APH72631.1 hypothetical protein BSQ44_15645 [Aquibium oceanicum]
MAGFFLIIVPMSRCVSRIAGAAVGALALISSLPLRASDRVAENSLDPVDVELVLAVDTSSSMTKEELALQRHGYAAALRSREVIQAIADGPHGRIALTYFEWGASGSRRMVVPWTAIGSAADARRVADQLQAAKVANLFQTSISGAIRHSMRVLKDNEFSGTRRVIDISGDGPNNEGGLVTLSRDAAVDEGVTINGLPLMLDPRAFAGGTAGTLDHYYADCVIGGPRAFILPVSDWDQFPAAVRLKLVIELSGGETLFRKASGTAAQFVAGRSDCTIGEKIWSGMERG